MTAAPRYLLDTNILIYLLAGTSDRLRMSVEQCEPGAVATSSLCAAELLHGLRDRGGSASAAMLLDVVSPLPFDVAAARAFAELPFRRGRLDRLIAAHALALGVTLVTNNERDFADVPGLAVENWTR